MFDKVSLTRLANSVITSKYLSADTDLNNINATCYFYTFPELDSYESLHYPIKSTVLTAKASWYGHNINNPNNNNYGVQYIWLEAKPNYIFSRYKESGVWKSWYQISGPGLDMPSGKFTNLDLQSSGNLYVAPANGIFSIKTLGTSSSTYCLFDIVSPTDNYLYAVRMNPNGGDNEQIIPVTKGFKLRLIYNGTLYKEYFRFVYANSEVPMDERTNFSW